MPTILQCIALTATLTSLAAQQPAVTASDPHIEARIQVVDPGRQVPRLPEPKPDDGAAARAAFSIEGRKLEWRIGQNVCVDAATVERELQALAAKKSNWHRPAGAERDEPIPLVIAPDAEVPWIDVLSFYDHAMASRMEFVQLAEIGPLCHWFVAKGVGDPVADGGAHVVPKIQYNEPDDAPAAWRRVIYVRQTGAVEFDGKPVFDPAKKEDDKPLRDLLAELARRSREKIGSREFGPQKLEICDAELLIHADSWCRYESVHRVLQVAASSKPAFWKFSFACGEYDFEKRLRDGERFPK